MTIRGYTGEGLPFEGSTPAAAHASWTGARAAGPRRRQQTDRYLRVLKAHGAAGITDHAASVLTGLPLSSINSIRHGLGSCVVDAQHPERVERAGARPTLRTRWAWVG